MRVRVASIVFGTLMWCAAGAADEIYLSDPGHTYASFETGHLGISWIRGRFNATSKVVIDRASRKGSIEATIDAKSVNTGHDARDKHIRSEDYLDVDKFPTITFRSSQLKFDGDALVAADGDLTIMGVTKPATLKVTLFRCIAHPVNKKEMCGADASTAIKRSEFGIKRGAVGIGDDVKISIQIEGYKS
jgi:polyisoprenoid-binding protein YceI